MMSIRRSLCAALPQAVIGVVLIGCGAAAPPTGAPASPSPTVAPTGPFALRAGTLAPGTYTTTAFQPTLTFTLDDSWRGLFPDDSDEVALEGTDGVFFAMTRVTEVVDPATWTPVAVPDDLVSWFTTHPSLTADAPRSSSIGGLTGQWVDVTVTDGSELEIFAYPSGNMRIAQGVKLRCHVLAMEGPDLTIVVGAPVKGFATALDMVQPVLDSLEIIPGS